MTIWQKLGSEVVTETALKIYSNKVRYPTLKSELEQLTRDSFKEAEVFLEEAEKIRQAEAEKTPDIPILLKEVHDLAIKGQKLSAISKYRAIKLCGLKEATEYVEGFIKQHQDNSLWQILQGKNPLAQAYYTDTAPMILNIPYQEVNVPNVNYDPNIKPNDLPKYGVISDLTQATKVDKGKDK